MELRQLEEIEVADQSHVNTFKGKLDKFLELIPDEPNAGGGQRGAATNSLICQVPFFNRSNGYK